ncbi:MAG TPA: N-6 DNA methylase, partial [bacterium]|nr:N-6 DNA methylase [bacterium]
MLSPTRTYINNLLRELSTGKAREHSYRPALKELLQTINPQVIAQNDPAQVDCGAPDFIVTNRNIPIGHIEVKDLGKDLSNKLFKEQFDRYRDSLENLIISNYLEFRFFIDGEQVESITIGEVKGEKIIPIPSAFARLEDLLKDFCTHTGQTITSAARLSKMMAGKARLLAHVIQQALASDSDTKANSTLHEQMEAFKQVLMHDIDAKQFADIYAQTIAYGMFAARLHDPSLDTFSRQEAAALIPKSNPFLRQLFQYIAGYDLDERIVWIVDNLAAIFNATDVAYILRDFGKATQKNDPMVHFYETFLAEYDPKLRKSRGVWYTPEPVVNFIVRAVDDILKQEFGLAQGLADTSKTRIKVQSQQKDSRSKDGYKTIEKEVHKVQILDPATGTGTFLTEVIKQIHQRFEGQQGIWSGY